MQHEAVDGVVIRVKDYGEHDRYLTILTQDGRLSLLSKGSRSMRGQQMSVSQLYTYGNFEYYRKGAAAPILKGGSAQESFYGLTTDLEKLNLASYFCDLAYELSDEGEDAGDLLRLLLNALYAISTDRYPPDLVKATLEFRLSADAGYTPDVAACRSCGTAEAEGYYLDVMNGSLICEDCLKKAGNQPAPIDDPVGAGALCRFPPSALAALHYLLSAPIERVFAFSLSDESERAAFCKAAETYLLSHLGRGFDSLDFYHSTKG